MDLAMLDPYLAMLDPYLAMLDLDPASPQTGPEIDL